MNNLMLSKKIANFDEERLLFTELLKPIYIKCIVNGYELIIQFCILGDDRTLIIGSFVDGTSVYTLYISNDQTIYYSFLSIQ